METLLTGMGIGEAAVTILSESGVPTPVVHTRMTPPASRMGPADDVEGKAKASPLWAKYGQRVDNESAREMLAARMAPPPPAGPAAPQQAPARKRAEEQKEAAGAVTGGVAAVSKFLQSREGKKLQQEVVRGVFGLLKKKF
jgi:chemotaxis response regulator CheB